MAPHRERALWASLIFGSVVLSAARAEAYRPFDGTDAAVAEPHTFELELGPIQYYREGRQSSLAAPALVLNFGLGWRTELVIDAQQSIVLGALQPNTPRLSLRGDDVLFKHVFLEGTEQGKPGPSIAAEAGVLTPETQEGSGFGASLDVITSYAGQAGAVHWNEWLQLTREHRADLFSGVIAEGPRSWPVRPVSELFYERTWGDHQTESLLLGAIWEARESLAFDLGLRGARIGNASVEEARLGLTWAIDMLPSASAAAPPPAGPRGGG